MKTWKIYKSPTFFGTWQFSFVFDDDDYYYYLIYDDVDGWEGWRFNTTRHPTYHQHNLRWNQCDPHRRATESNWLEVLVMAGKSEAEVMRMIEAAE